MAEDSKGSGVRSPSPERQAEQIRQLQRDRDEIRAFLWPDAGDTLREQFRRRESELATRIQAAESALRAEIQAVADKVGRLYWVCGVFAVLIASVLGVARFVVGLIGG